MQVPEWLKSAGFFVVIMIVWDILRLFLQAYVTTLFMKNKFDKIEGAIEDVEEAIEEENGEES